MSDISARVSLLEDLTTDAVLTGLRTRRKERSDPSVQAAAAAAAAPYRSAAAVLHVFDPAKLHPLGEGPVGAPPPLSELSHPPVGYVGSLLRSLATEQRVAALAEFGDRERMRQALARNPDREPTVVQRLFERWLDDTLNIDELSYSELESLRQLYEWELERFAPLPPRAAVEAARARRASIALFEHLVDQSFVGREAELQRLRDYVGVVSPSAWARVKSFLSRGPRAPLVLVGPGGVGKTALIGRFLIEHVTSPHQGWFPFVYLPFDTQTIDVREPWTLLNLASEQLSSQALPPAETAGASGNDDQGQHVEAAFAAFRRAVGHYRDERARLLSRTAAIASQRIRFNQSAEAHDLLYGRFARLLNALATRAGRHQKAKGVPVVMVLDTFEEVVYRTNEDLEGLWRMLARVQAEFPALRVVISGRSLPRPFTVGDLTPQIVPLGDLTEADANTLLERLGTQQAGVRAAIVRQVGRNPLTLKLAARAARELPVTQQGFEGLKPRRTFLMEVAPEVVRGQLYRRILDHIHDPQVRALAHPGMALRRVTPLLIQDVLARICPLEGDMADGLTEARAEQLFEALRQEHTLVRLDDDLSLRYREEVRTPMLRLLSADKPDLVTAIHRAAARHYASLPDAGPVERAEELYHLMMLNEPVANLEPRWMEGVDRYLGSAVEEIPDEQKIWLASHMSIELPPDVYARADVLEWERLIGGKALEAARYEDPMRVLKLLEQRTERSPESPLYALEIRARMNLGEKEPAQYQQALEISRRAIETWPMNNLGRLAEIMWLGGQAAQQMGGVLWARQTLWDLVELTSRLTSPLPRVQALAELVVLVDGLERDGVRGDLAALLRDISPDQVDRERALVRLACVRLGLEHADVVMRLLPMISQDLLWRFPQDPALVAAALPELLAVLADASTPEWIGLRDRLIQGQSSVAELPPVLEEVLQLARQTPSPAGLKAALAILAAEKGDLRASGLAGLEDYRESFELRAISEAAL